MANKRRFKIAFSFPGEHRNLIENIAEKLKSIYGQESILYDKYHRAEFARPNLDLYLQDLYHNDSELIIVFICAEYNQKEWCGIEWRAIRDILNQKCSDERIMFVKCGVGSVNGVFGTIDGYIDSNSVSIDNIVNDIRLRYESICGKKQKKQNKIELKKQAIFGIDLGTTYSCIAIVDSAGNPKIISNSKSEQIIPSVVAFPPKEAIIVGIEAENILSNNAQNHIPCVKCIKRRMGEGYIQKINGEDYLPEDIAAAILEYLVKGANKTLGKNIFNSIRDVVITVPAYFGYKERIATKKAAENAGLRVLRLISEPTAAAVSYVYEHCDNKQKKRIVMVYDLGGGTFDVSIVEICEESINVLAVGGDHHLGGEDWNKILKEYLINEFQKITKCTRESIDIDLSCKNFDSKVECVKRELSKSNLALVEVSANGRTEIINVSRTIFEEKTDVLLQATKLIIRDTVEKACNKIGKEQYDFSIIDDVLLVGGSSRMPQVSQLFETEFKISPFLCDPDLIVAKGAAIVAQLLLSSQNDDSLKDVSSKTYGVVAFEDEEGVEPKICNIFFRNTEIPSIQCQVFGTMEDNQRKIEIDIYESDAIELEKHINIEEGTLVDTFTFKLPRSLPKDSEIVISMTLNYNQLLIVTIEDLTTGKTFEKKVVLNKNVLKLAERTVTNKK